MGSKHLGLIVRSLLLALALSFLFLADAEASGEDDAANWRWADQVMVRNGFRQVAVEYVHRARLTVEYPGWTFGNGGVNIPANEIWLEGWYEPTARHEMLNYAYVWWLLDFDQFAPGSFIAQSWAAFRATPLYPQAWAMYGVGPPATIEEYAANWPRYLPGMVDSFSLAAWRGQRNAWHRLFLETP